MRRPLALIVALTATVSSAQHNQAAGLFTEARQLPLVTQTVHVTARGGMAELHLVQVFFNDGPDLGQADYQLHLPQQTAITSFAFWRGQELIRAQLKAKDAAEAAHAKAAASGRNTALLKTDSGVQRFSVFPVKGGEYQRVELTLSMPIVRDLGRNQIALAMDRFLARGSATAAVVVDLHSDEPISDLGASGVRAKVVSRGERTAQLAFTTEVPVEVWWTEKVAPLSVTASAIPVDGGGRAIALRVLLDDASEWRAASRQMLLFVDGSFSMRRRRAAVAQLIDRVLERAPAAVEVWSVGEKLRRVDTSGGGQAIAGQILSESGFTSNGRQFLTAMKEARCDRPEVRCLAVTDLTISGLDVLLPEQEKFIFLADAHERAYLGDSLPTELPVFQPDVEAPGKLRALVDERVRAALEIVAVSQSQKTLEAIRPPTLRTGEGGLLRLYFEADEARTLDVSMRIAGKTVPNVRVPVTAIEAESPEGRIVRHGFWERKLAAWMSAYGKSPDSELKKQIVAASLREGIPTAFTALHAESPELSLAAIKPGDPLLTVRPEPGLVKVTAWYPFGEERTLVQDDASSPFQDRFLVPRGWSDRGYPVEVFKHYADGTVIQDRAWYSLDDLAPVLSLVPVDADSLELLPAEGGDPLSQVRVEFQDGKVRTLSPVAGRWLIERAGLPSRYTVVARDRAGNTTHLTVGESARVPAQPSAAPAVAAALPDDLSLLTASTAARVHFEGGQARVEVLGTTWSYPHAQAPLRSSQITAALSFPDGVLFGTERGDLVRVTCSESCSAVQWGDRFGEHAIRGIARLDDGAALVGVLGLGLYEVDGSRTNKSKLDVGSDFVTGVERDGKEVLVATAYNGLWRITGRRAIQSRFPSKHVSALRRSGTRVAIDSGVRSYVQRGRDRFVPVASAERRVGSDALMTSALYDGQLYLGGFDRGLLQRKADRLEEVPLALTVLERQFNALAVFDGALWAATEGGLLRLKKDGHAWSVERVLPEAAQDVSAGKDRVAVALSAGVAIVARDREVTRIHSQSGADVRRIFAVAWSGDALYAGGMDGLFRIEGETARRITSSDGFDGGWVTALASHEGEVFAGTYDLGVYRLTGVQAAPVAGTEGQWVPLRALQSVEGSLWIGGLGMPARTMTGDVVRALHLPVRDTNGFAMTGTELVALTSEGCVVVPRTVFAARHD